jgi:hypothetical protein
MANELHRVRVMSVRSVLPGAARRTAHAAVRQPTPASPWLGPPRTRVRMTRGASAQRFMAGGFDGWHLHKGLWIED